MVSDSAQFSALATRACKPELVGTGLTIYNCIGYLMTILSIQLAQSLTGILTMQCVSLVIAIGPICGALIILPRVKLDGLWLPAYLQLKSGGTSGGAPTVRKLDSIQVVSADPKLQQPQQQQQPQKSIEMAANPNNALRLPNNRNGSNVAQSDPHAEVAGFEIGDNVPEYDTPPLSPIRNGGDGAGAASMSAILGNSHTSLTPLTIHKPSPTATGDDLTLQSKFNNTFSQAASKMSKLLTLPPRLGGPQQQQLQPHDSSGEHNSEEDRKNGMKKRLLDYRSDYSSSAGHEPELLLEQGNNVYQHHHHQSDTGSLMTKPRVFGAATNASQGLVVSSPTSSSSTDSAP